MYRLGCLRIRSERHGSTDASGSKEPSGTTAWDAAKVSTSGRLSAEVGSTCTSSACDCTCCTTVIAD